MPNLLLQITSLITNLTLIIFIIIYFFRLRAKEKELEKKANNLDTNYHQVVDTALTKEHKILEDAETEANQIIMSAQNFSQAYQESFNQSMQKIIGEVQKIAVEVSQNFINSYQAS